MADYCRCGGKYAQTLSVDAFTQQIRTFGNIARCVCTCVYVCMCMHACMWKFENGKILKNNAMHVISFSTQPQALLVLCIASGFFNDTKLTHSLGQLCGCSIPSQLCECVGLAASQEACEWFWGHRSSPCMVLNMTPLVVLKSYAGVWLFTRLHKRPLAAHTFLAHSSKEATHGGWLTAQSPSSVTYLISPSFVHSRSHRKFLTTIRMR